VTFAFVWGWIVFVVPALAFVVGGWLWADLVFKARRNFSWRVAWVFGLAAVLICFILFILSVLIAVSTCAAPAATGTTSVVAACTGAPQRWYLVLHDWQAGIGATIGLLGVAWSTIYNKVFA
jgi:hypothetical protein